jgi:hypothetical protein
MVTLGILAVVGAATWLSVAYANAARLGSVSPGPGVSTNQHTPRIVLNVDHASTLTSYTVTIDRLDVTQHVVREGSGLVVEGVPLADGPHSVRIRAHASGLFGGELDKSWTFRVDTRTPRLHLATNLSGWLQTHDLVLIGTTEPRARITAQAGEARFATTAGPGGRFAVAVRLVDGEMPLTLTALDAAGNRDVQQRSLRVDGTPPTITLEAPKLASRPLPLLSGSIADTALATTTVTLDGRPFKLGHRPARPLAEGVHWLKVTATDQAGNVGRALDRILVDSTERLGTASLIRGARGADVTALQRQLHGLGLYRKPFTAVYDRRTIAAVSEFQHSHDMPVDGIAGTDTVGALTTHVVIDESQHSLTLYRAGKRPLTFGVAVGQPAYPTPTGHFFIISKVENPTWVPPPDAPWAQGALPIPPGPDNPLGTRWMGLSAPGVGIHGTNDPSSIGYSVSHGCIRMQVPNAEELFTMVYVGTSVTIRA